MEQKKVFISYSWDSDEHKNWVSKLAGDLERLNDFHVIWDGYDLDSFVDKNLFMEDAVTHADFTIIVATTAYAAKADNREGGVGIETFLNTAKHWQKMLESKRSNSIVVLKERDSMPTYLKGHFYVDFTNESNYHAQFHELINKLNEKPKYKRPQKNQISSEVKAYQLTKAAEIIGIGARNRKCVISTQEGTDFSGSNRVKFELWETNTPAQVHILALHNNININQTLRRAVDEIIHRKIPITNLTVLRPKEKRKNSESIDTIFLEKSGRTFNSLNLVELTYEDYVWNYCIDESFKTTEAPDAIDFYTSQELASASQTYGSAINHLIEKLTNESGCCTQLVIGSGGIGKTSLCLSLVQKLIETHGKKILTVLIRSEDIRKYLETADVSPPVVQSIYDIYELQAKYLKHVNLFDKKTFELSIVSGSIAIIIDGLDELSSVFKEKFDLKSFLKSIDSLHTELGYGRILLTTRDNSLVSTAEIEQLSFDSYELLGFKIENCKNYLRRRFRAYDSTDATCNKITAKVQESLLYGENRIIPFFVDVIANIYEENILQHDSLDFEIKLDSPPYPSLNEITDHILYSICEREKTRHKLSIEPSDLIELFCYMNQEFGEVWSIDSVKDTASAFFGNNGENLDEYIRKNPLLKAESGNVRFKYDFLHSYFNSLNLFNGFISSNTSITFAQSVAKLTHDSSEMKDVSKFYNGRYDEFLLSAQNLILDYKVKLAAIKKQVERSSVISAIENIIFLSHSIKNTTKETFTSDVKNIYQQNDATIEYLYIKGDLPPFDFTGVTVTHSRFKNYPKFLGSKFDGATFIYSDFVSCHNDSYRNSDLLKAKIDKSTCSLGDLSDSVVMLDNTSKINSQLLRDEAESFLSSFYRGSIFRDNNTVHMNFSNHIPGLKRKAFNKLLSNNFIVVSSEKEVDTFYKIGDSFKESVRKFLNDGYKDGKMKSFLRFIEG
mgnify:CR=1 FL=1